MLRITTTRYTNWCVFFKALVAFFPLFIWIPQNGSSTLKNLIARLRRVAACVYRDDERSFEAPADHIFAFFQGKHNHASTLPLSYLVSHTRPVYSQARCWRHRRCTGTPFRHLPFTILRTYLAIYVAISELKRQDLRSQAKCYSHQGMVINDVVFWWPKRHAKKWRLLH